MSHKQGYSLADFQQGKVSGVDPDTWEQHLSPDEFEKHFGMTLDAFNKLPKWKRLNKTRPLRTW